MPIKIAGQVTVDAPREEVWKSLFDLDVIRDTAAHVPGVDIERLDQIDETHYEGTATIGVAAVKGRYDGKVTILEQRPPEFIRVRGEGKGGGNWTSGEGSLTLTEQDGKTVMIYSGQGNLSGPLASLGQRLVDTVGRQFIDQGSKVFAEEISARHRAKMAQASVPEPLAVAPAPALPISASQRNIPAWGIALAIVIVLLIAFAIYSSLPR